MDTVDACARIALLWLPLIAATPFSGRAQTADDATGTPPPTVATYSPSPAPTSPLVRMILEPSDALAKALAIQSGAQSDSNRVAADTLWFIAVTAIGTMILAFATTVLAVSTRQAARATERAARATEDTATSTRDMAQATIDSVKLTVQSYEASQTPNLFPQEPQIPQWRNAPREFDLQFEVHNGSDIPATGVEVWASLKLSGRIDTEEPIRLDHAPFTLPPHDTHTVRTVCGGNWYESVHIAKDSFLELTIAARCHGFRNKKPERAVKYVYDAGRGFVRVSEQFTPDVGGEETA